MPSSIWSNPDKINALREFLNDFIRLQGMTPENIIDSLVEFEPNASRRPTARALRNFIGNKAKRPRKFDALDTLTVWLVSYVRANGCEDVRHHVLLQNISDIALLLYPAKSIMNQVASSPRDIGTVSVIIASFLHVDALAISNMEDVLFRKSDYLPEKARFQRHFLCYRYHSRPGYVAKSFLSVFGKSIQTPGVCRFVHMFKGTSGGERKSDGILIPMKHGIYFIGQSGNGEVLKLIAMRIFSPNRPIHEGVVISSDDDSDIITSRIILVDTDINESAKAGIGVLHEKDLGSEIRPYISRMRNKIDFALTRDVFLDGKHIDQQKMVTVIGDALKDSNGKARLTDEAGDAFNPAANRHYTFNSVLKVWSDSEEGPM